MLLSAVILRGTRASQPAATAVPTGSLYYVTDEKVTERSNGATWDSYSAPVLVTSIGLTFTSDTASQADSDPGNGLFRWNNATQSSATSLFLDNQTADAISVTTLYATLPAQGLIHLQQGDDATKWQLWKWTAFSVDGTGYRKFTVTSQAYGGAIANTKTTLVQFLPLPGSVGRHAIPIMAAAMTPSASDGCAALATIATTANQPDSQSLDFDPTTVQYAQFAIPMPKSWALGTVTFKALWSHAATTVNFGVVWQLQGLAVSDNEGIAQAYGTVQTSTDTGGTTNNLYSSPESSAITIAGTPAAEDTVFFRVARLATDGSDTMAINARLHAIVLYITTGAENDL